ncbi:hypothetical protein BSS2_II0647 [Brucella suis bv. 1 str. S2]|uniref:Uncharacterized protein n=1 Tax=Brucella suis biovar 1 (strain 1330) TaxID=204722 RepID=A0A0H3GFH1_BRUSU|nr:hypothetical protein BRA0680 [Brucella suis 1330]AEM20142.1 hypothetical protein BS1330_II0673 [Brucella suis 1330]AEU07813.1 hypothetical protein BSVBI22_B0672 [Brucella suis VBI22]AHN48409.1 hypothetical protein BSS2_II0647 [Brucella suis bv. 1 str. S2]CDL78216.1 unnamed protein product [Brucella canis str. Oliveri]
MYFMSSSYRHFVNKMKLSNSGKISGNTVEFA